VPADCPNPNQYCKVTNCAVAGGTCTTKPVAGDGAKAVCGCNKVTYWNESLAAHDGVNVTSAAGACPKLTGVPCNTINVSCPSGLFCDLRVGGGSALCSANLSGTCWRLPANCPATAGQLSGCGGSANADCFNSCEVIRDETPAYSDVRCP